MTDCPLEGAPGLIVAGYPDAPADPEAAADFFTELLTIPEMGGLEFSWRDDHELSSLRQVVPQLTATQVAMVTDIRSLTSASVTDRAVGLASPNETGRRKAVTLTAAILHGAAMLNTWAGRTVVRAVEVHSAPGFAPDADRPNARALETSLAELAPHVPAGSELLVEHCDARIPGRAFDKGFLDLADELAVVRRLVDDGLTSLGMSLNWARSARELRDPSRIGEHLSALDEAGLLRAFTFSGVAATRTSHGPAWADRHLPIADPLDSTLAEPRSLLTTTAIAKVAPHLIGVPIALKIKAPKGTNLSHRRRLIRDNLRTLAHALSATHSAHDTNERER